MMLHNVTHKLNGIALALLLSGCAAVGPDYQAPQTQGFDAPKVAVQTVTERESQWWNLFGDAQLLALIDQVIANNPSLEAARANIDAAYAVFEDVDNDDWLQGNLEISSQAQDQVIPGFDTQRRNVRSYRGGANLTWSLDLFGKLDRAAQAANASAEAQVFAWHDLRVELIAQTATLYADYMGLKKRIQVAERNIESLHTTESITRARVDAGYASQLDLLRTQAQRLGVEASIPALRAAAATAKNTLAALTGNAPADFTLRFAQGDMLTLQQPLAIGDPKKLLQRRADVHQAERQLAAATAQLGVDTADLYPDISISGFVGFLAGDLSNLGSQTKAWSVAPSMTWQGLDWVSVQARIDRSDAQRRAALANFRQQLLAALQESQTALDRYAHTQQQEHLLRAQVEASQDSLSLAKLQYEAGAIDLLDMLDSERVLLAAEDNMTQAQARLMTDLVEVYRSFGGGFTAPANTATSTTLALGQ